MLLQILENDFNEIILLTHHIFAVQFDYFSCDNFILLFIILVNFINKNIIFGYVENIIGLTKEMLLYNLWYGFCFGKYLWHTNFMKKTCYSFHALEVEYQF